MELLRASIADTRRQLDDTGKCYASDEQNPKVTARAVEEGAQESLAHSPHVKQRVHWHRDTQSQPCHGITLEKKRHIISLLPNTAWVVDSVMDKHKRLSQRLCLEREQRRESSGTIAPHASPDGVKVRRELLDAKSATSGSLRCLPGEMLSDMENDARLPCIADGQRGRVWKGNRDGCVPTSDQINVGKRSKVPFNVLTSQQEPFNASRETVAMACQGNTHSWAPHSCSVRGRSPTVPGKLDHAADCSLDKLSSSLPIPEPSGGSPLLSRNRARSRSVSLPLKADSKVQDLLSFAGRQNSLNIRQFTVEDGRAIRRAGSSSGPMLDDVGWREHKAPARAGSNKTMRVEDACLCHHAVLNKDTFAHSRGNGVEASCAQWDSVPVDRNPWLLQQEYFRGPIKHLQGTSLESHSRPKVDSTPLHCRDQLKPKASNQNSHALNRSYEVQTPSPLWQQCSRQTADAVPLLLRGAAEPAVTLKEQRSCIGRAASRRALPVGTPACRREEEIGAARDIFPAAASQSTGVLTRSGSALGLLMHGHSSGLNATLVATPLDVQRSNRVFAVAKGFLTRRLLRSEKVQHLVRVIKDTRELALSIHGDRSKNSLGLSDSSFHKRLLKQIQAALEEIHNIFFVLSLGQRMAILKRDKGSAASKRIMGTDRIPCWRASFDASNMEGEMSQRRGAINAISKELLEAIMHRTVKTYVRS